MTVPRIWVAVALSLLLHIALMWKWLPQIRLPSLEDKRDEPGGSLVVRLAPPPRPPSAPPSRPPAAPVLQAPPSPMRESRPAPPPPPPPPSAPVIALNRPADAPPVSAAPPPVAVPAPAPPRPPAASDFASDIEARRRARNEPAPPAQTGGLPAAMATAPQQLEDDKDRSNRIVAGNLAPRRQAFGYDPSKSGGVFEIKRVGVSDAEFMFFGWDKAIRRNTMQQIEVQKGNNSDTRIAVIRKMIAIIREYEVEDFLWESQRLGRNVNLSARLRDNAGLEQFLMREFFPEDPRAR